MEPVTLAFLIIAAVLFALAAGGVVAPRIQLGWAGAPCFTLAALLPAIF